MQSPRRSSGTAPGGHEKPLGHSHSARAESERDRIFERDRQESKALFARLSVFAGSFPLAASEEVCEAGLDALGALVDLSLLKPITASGRS